MSPMADYSALMQHDTQTLLARLLGMAATEEPFAPGPAPFQVPEHRRAGSPVTPGLPWAPALSYHGQMQAARPGGLEAQCVAAGRRFPHVPAHLAWSTAAFPPDLPLTPVSEGSSASFLELAGALQMSMARPVSAEPGRSPTIPLASPPPDDPPSPGAADTKVPPVQGKIVFDEQRRLEYFDCYIVALDQHLRLLTDKGLEPERFGADIEDNYAFYKNTAQSKRPEYETTMNRLTCRLAYLNRDKLKSYPRDIVGQIATAYRNSDPSTMSRRAKTNMRATSADQAQRRPKRKASSPYEKLKRGSPLLSMSVETSSTVRPASDSFFPPIAATAGPCIRRHSTGCISMPPTEPSNVSNLFFGPSMHPTSSVEHEDALARQDALEPPISPLSPHPVNYLTYALLMNGTPVLIPSAQVVWPQLATPQDAQQMLHFQGHPSQLPLAGLVAAADCHRNGTPPVAPWTLDGLQHQGGLDGM